MKLPAKHVIRSCVVIPTTVVWVVFAAWGQVSAHNGAVAAATPVSEILIDGHFDDWPAHIEAHGIKRSEYEEPYSGASDFQGTFRIAYTPGTPHLYVAFEIGDDSFVGHDGDVVSVDNVGLYVDVDHPERHPGTAWGDRAPRSRLLPGIWSSWFLDTPPAGSAAERLAWADVARVRDGALTRYEWRISVDQITGKSEPLEAGQVIGLGVLCSSARRAVIAVMLLFTRRGSCCSFEWVCLPHSGGRK